MGGEGEGAVTGRREDPLADFDVFFSHNSHDKPAVRELARALEQRGVNVWLDEDQLVPGKNALPQLEKGIEASTAAAVLIGQDGLGPWEHEETQALLRRAVELGRSVIPVLLPGAPDQPRLPLFLASRVWVDLRPGLAPEGVARLLCGIRGVVPPQVASRRTGRTDGAPFVVGAPLERGARSFVGRKAQIAEIQRCFELGQPVQILGERRMGKTSLLHQVPDWLPSGMPWALLRAQGHCGSCERELVAALATELGRSDIAAATASGELGAAAALERLVPCALLLDEADSLARPEHAFTTGFFEQCRALGQARRLLFVCTAATDIAQQFSGVGLTSRFLNDSRKICVGQLEISARQELIGMAKGPPSEALKEALQQFAGFALLVQAVGDALGHGLPIDEAVDQVRIDLDGTCFAVWWLRRNENERRLLRRAQEGVPRRGQSDGERRALRALVARGLVEEGTDAFTLPGDAWRDFVGGR